MAGIPLRLVITLVVGVAALAVSPRAFACGGSTGYTYAGVGASRPAFGISARVTAVADYDVRHGHVAAWVGLGGPGEGAGGSDEWLQAGLSRFPEAAGNDVYYEVALPNRSPVYHQVRADLLPGVTVRVAVLEIPGRRNWWRVWLDGEPVSQPILLPGSHHRWAPIATAEAWDGGTGGACNTFLYRFGHVRIARRPGGGWGTSPRGYVIRSSTTRVRRAHRGDDFLAAEGWLARRLLASLKP